MQFSIRIDAGNIIKSNSLVRNCRYCWRKESFIKSIIGAIIFSYCRRPAGRPGRRAGCARRYGGERTIVNNNIEPPHPFVNRGYQHIEHACNYEWVICEDCSGKGQRERNRCHLCDGSGKIALCANCYVNGKRFLNSLERKSDQKKGIPDDLH